MKKLLVSIGIVVALSGCSSTPADPDSNRAAGGYVSYYHDAAHKVSCWLFVAYYKGGIYCLPDSQVTLP